MNNHTHDAELTAAENGGRFTYGRTSRFAAIPDQMAAPRVQLTMRCMPRCVLVLASTLPPVAPPLYAVRYSALDQLLPSGNPDLGAPLLFHDSFGVPARDHYTQVMRMSHGPEVPMP